MSHFTVLVVGEDPEGQLAPFQENNMGDCPEEYLEFNDQEDEFLEEYRTGGTEMVRMPDGRLLYPDDDEFRKEGAMGTGSDTHQVPDHLKVEEIKFTERYIDFETFCEEWHGHSKRDEKKGRYGYWENPNAKWDWYQLGGRWNGFFRVKRGKRGVKGAAGLLTEPDRHPRAADQCRKGEIDWEAMDKKTLDERRAAWKRYEKELAKVEKEWAAGKIKDYVDEKRGGEVTPAQVIYERRKDNAYMPVGGFFRKGPKHATLEEYLAEPISHTTFAVLKDGVWYEKGSMGWWAIVTDEKDEGEWKAEFRKLLEGLPDDTLLSVYDCHI